VPRGSERTRKAASQALSRVHAHLHSLHHISERWGGARHDALRRPHGDGTEAAGHTPATAYGQARAQNTSPAPRRPGQPRCAHAFPSVAASATSPSRTHLGAHSRRLRSSVPVLVVTQRSFLYGPASRAQASGRASRRTPCLQRRLTVHAVSQMLVTAASFCALRGGGAARLLSTRGEIRSGSSFRSWLVAAGGPTGTRTGSAVAAHLPARCPRRDRRRRPPRRRQEEGGGHAARHPPGQRLPRRASTPSAVQTTWTASLWPRARATGAAGGLRGGSARSRLTTSTPWPRSRSRARHALPLPAPLHRSRTAVPHSPPCRCLVRRAASTASPSSPSFRSTGTRRSASKGRPRKTTCRPLPR